MTFGKPITLDPQKVYVSLATIAAVLIFFAGMTYKAATCALSVRDDIAAILADVALIRGSQWTIDDQGRWIRAAEKANRDITLPDADEIVRQRTR